ncbi:sensor histidine kinase [Martelella lutilitoris]|uniref:histidine kinase n=1 Tax=Martelella lutilitoris TaxID=2583532 RepID=A0A5C4JT04_9HYPH|nr:sensor histidine kinase [Martelella lutilitoris]TNB48468.1 sensor histidine kinase [Martelella lutilitoris]
MFAKAETRRPYSLRRRLLFGMTALLLVIMASISGVLWSYARSAANRSYDFLLTAAALSVLERMTSTPDGIRVDIPSSALEMMGLAEEDRVFYRVFREGGETLTGEGDLPLPENFANDGKARYFDARYDGENFRFLTKGRILLLNDVPTWFYVQIGQTRRARDSLQMSMITNGLAGLLVLAIVGIGFAWFGIDRAMRPLASIEADMRSRDPNDLTPLSAQPPREMARLIEAINNFMNRLETSREHSQGFIADVAHQMRTSLAALHAQLSIAVDMCDTENLRKRLTIAETQAWRTIRLTNQLLSHAMVLHRANNLPREEVDLTQVVRNVVEDVLRETPDIDVEFSFSRDAIDGRSDVIMADRVAVREALRNIIDNAIKHGGTNDRIDIALEPARISGRDAIRIAIEDGGPGIPEAERTKVLQRFYSLNKTNAGSGLGLSIVEAVAESHGGRVALATSRRGGLRVTLDLPVA